ncbi:methyl-accepting chemotaxis protein [Reinekea blandensis]|uniref:Methyl-accepting chemotaxis protein n=1 Tax=Reinekea blandensis MED297 TaxID=314283 RepID=A4BJ27_9GAMM|nr:methyl-accepting chemotaxis protein [Reinekea blandensis]EAR07872.1 methyl-accepting chemotaxis protein [Reinekea sp. MED297] [Reinekea blandensis MED297]
MKIKTQVSASLTGIVLLLVIVAGGGYLATSVVNQAGSVLGTALVPGVQGYNNLRYETLEIALQAFRGDIDGVQSQAAPLIPRIEAFMVTQPDSPFYGDQVLQEGLTYIGDTLLAVVRTASLQQAGQPPTPEFVEALRALEAMEVRAAEVIQYLVDSTMARVNGVIATSVRILIIVSLIAVLIAIVVGTLLTRKLNRGLVSLNASFRQISDGDLTVQADDSSKDEFGEIASYFNGLASNLKNTVGELGQMMSTLSELSTRFRDSGVRFQERATQTSDETQQVATAMTEMAATIREVAQNAEATSGQAQNASTQARDARGLVATSVTNSQTLQTQMTDISGQVLQLKDKTESISSVIDVIQGIAEQTNLLALNAAIEAARAGEQGRGFAVVADEVRTLATRTAQSTQEIIDVIQALQSMSESTSQQITKGRESVEANAEAIAAIESSLTTILDNISSISDMNHQIATNSQEQSHVAEEMNTNVVRISDLSEDNAAQTRQINEDIGTIDELVTSVRELISHFRY